jgi:glycosyltransferase involved in cell wall biosynthesis
MGFLRGDGWSFTSKSVCYTVRMDKKSLDLSVIIPVVNEEKIIAPIISQIKTALDALDYQYEILLIDDGSEDNTAMIAQEAGARVISHPENIGNGAAIKTGIRNAKGKILVMMDGDGQHPPEDLPRLLQALGSYDMVVGARVKASETSAHRDFANRIYNYLASYISGRKIEDLTSGFRVIKAEAARRFVYLLPNTFSYPTTITLAVLRSGRSLVYVPYQARRRVGKSKIKLIRDGIRFLLIILRISTYFSPLKVFIPVSVLMFLLGFGYGLFKVIFLHTRYGPTSAMLMTVSVVVFMVGLVSEQVAQLRFHWSEKFSERYDIDE